ncbi:MAK10-like protein [Tanacetum coccineum]
MASQDARLSKFEADFKQQQNEMTNKIDIVLKAITDRIAGTLPSNTVKNPKLSTSPVFSACSYPIIDPQCSSHPSISINAIKAHSKEANISHTSFLQTRMGIEPQQPEEPKPTLKDEFQDLHLNLPVLKVLAHALIYNAILDKYVESLELGKNGSAFVQGEIPAKMEDPGLFTLPCRLGDSEPFDTLADLGSCVNIIPLYLFKKLNIGLLEETGHIFGLADGTKSYPVGIVKDVEVHIGKLKLLNDFYVIDMKKDPETPLLVGRGFLSTANTVIDYRMAKIAVGDGITRSVFGVKGVNLGEEEAPYWTTLGKRESYKPRPGSDGVGAQTPYYARKDFLDCHLPREWEIARDAELNPFKDALVFRRMYNSLSDLEKEHTKSVYLRNEEDKRRGVEYVMSKILGFYKECLELGPEYVTGMDDEGEVTLYLMRKSLEDLRMFSLDDSWRMIQPEFAQILRVPCEGVCMFSSEWSIASLPNCIDPNPIYMPPIENPKVMCDAIFYERPPGKTRKVKGQSVVLDPYQMVNSEMKLDFKKWETILSENAIISQETKIIQMLVSCTCSIVLPFKNHSSCLLHFHENGKCNQKRLHGASLWNAPYSPL